MSKMEITKCDGCGRTTEDMWAECGWVEVAGRVALSGGRDEQGNPMTSSVPLGHYCARPLLLPGRAPERARPGGAAGRVRRDHHQHQAAPAALNRARWVWIPPLAPARAGGRRPGV